MFQPDFSTFDGIEIECKSSEEGREFQLQMVLKSFSENFFYFSTFKPEKEYKIIKLPFQEFKMNREGKNIGNVRNENLSNDLNVDSLGIGVESFDLGDFSMEIKSIKIYKH
jgi:hypothetical protein